MARISKRVIAVNSIGILGYMAGFAAWVLFLAVIAVFVMSNAAFVPSPQTPPPTASFRHEANSIVMVLGYMVAVIGAVVTVGVLVTAPYFISKWASKWLRRCMTLAKIKPGLVWLWLAKAFFLTLPGIGIVIIMGLNGSGDMLVLLFIAILSVSVVSALLFGLQHIVARWLKVAVRDVW